MRYATPVPQKRDLVLAGGGYGHLEVIRQLGLYPLADVRVTCISLESVVPFGGRLARAIRDNLPEEQWTLDIRKACAWAGVRFVNRRVVGVDTEGRRVLLEDHPPIRFDVLSLNTGGVLHCPPGLEPADWIWPVRPFRKLIARLHGDMERLSRETGKAVISVVGGGAAACELTLAIRDALDRCGRNGIRMRVIAHALLPDFHPKAARLMADHFHSRGIELISGHRVVKGEDHRLMLDNGQWLDTNAAILATGVRAPEWVSQTGLACTQEGFLSVNTHLQTSDPAIFALGDVAQTPVPVPHNRITAVEEGRLLADNLHRHLAMRPLKSFHEHVSGRAIIDLGQGRALMVGRRLVTEGRVPALIKAQRDDLYFEQLTHLPELPEDEDRNRPRVIVADDLPLESLAMDPQGAASKMGRSQVNRVLKRLGVETVAGIASGVAEADDAAVVRVPAGKDWVQAVSMLRRVLSDPWMFGRIATLHGLASIYAMGGEAHSVMATAVVPFAADPLMEEDLFQLMSGCLHELNRHQAALIGGHSAEGMEMMFGITVNGTVAEGCWLPKRLQQAGLGLVLVKALGTGFVLTAHRHARARSAWVEETLGSMLQPVREAVHIARQFGVRHCTDVTGYGLGGNLAEMVRDTALDIHLRLTALPLLAGVDEVLQRNVKPPLYHQNLHARHLMDVDEALTRETAWHALFDPQTSGGLVFAVPLASATALAAALSAAGYRAAVVGEVVEGRGRIRVTAG